MVPVINLMSCPRLPVPADVMQHVAQIESSGNRFAIGVVGGQLEHQPRNLGEAIATARMLQSRGYDYSLGITQINRNNLLRYGLDTYEKAFDICANATAGAYILAKCYGRSGGDWGKAFSCYYSGNFSTGYRDGYVRRILDSLNAASTSAAIPIHPQVARLRANRASADLIAERGNPDYRVSIRSIAMHAAAGALVPAAPGETGSAKSPVSERQPDSAGPGPVAITPSVSAPHATSPRDFSGRASFPLTHTASDQPSTDAPATDAAFVF